MALSPNAAFVQGRGGEAGRTSPQEIATDNEELGIAGVNDELGASGSKDLTVDKGVPDDAALPGLTNCQNPRCVFASSAKITLPTSPVGSRYAPVPCLELLWPPAPNLIGA